MITLMLDRERISRIVRQRRARKALTQTELAIASGLSLPTVQNIESAIGKKAATGRTLRKLAKGFEINADEFLKELGFEDDDSPSSLHPGPTFHAPPTFLLPCPASHWAELVDVDGVTDERDQRIVGQGLFRVKISGRCMEPNWPDGSFVEFEIWRHDSHPPEGEDVALTTSAGMTTFKRLSIDKAKQEYVLRSINPEMPVELRVPYTETARIAVAVGTFTPKRR